MPPHAHSISRFVIRVCIWGAILALACFYPGYWSVRSGVLHSTRPIVHHPTGITVNAPVLKIESISKLTPQPCYDSVTEVVTSPDVMIDSATILPAGDYEFLHELGHSFERHFNLLRITPDMLHPAPGWTVIDVKDNFVTLRHQKGVYRHYRFFVLPQNTTVWYSGMRLFGILDIPNFEVDFEEKAYAISPHKHWLEKAYTIYASKQIITEFVIRLLLAELLAVIGCLRCCKVWPWRRTY